MSGINPICNNVSFSGVVVPATELDNYKLPNGNDPKLIMFSEKERSAMREKEKEIKEAIKNNADLVKQMEKVGLDVGVANDSIYIRNNYKALTIDFNLPVKDPNDPEKRKTRSLTEFLKVKLEKLINDSTKDINYEVLNKPVDEISERRARYAHYSGFRDSWERWA